MTTSIFKKIVLYVGNSIYLYFPVILFWQFVFWHGDPDGERYVLAFRVFSVAALVHLIVLANFRKPVDRFALATDIWIIVCGVLSWLAFWDFLRYFGDHLRVTGYWIIVFLVGIISTYAINGGLIGSRSAPKEHVRAFSLKILLLIGIMLVISYGFRDETLWAAVLPTIFLSALSRKYCRNANGENLVI